MFKKIDILRIMGILVSVALLLQLYSCAVPTDSDKRIAEYSAIIEKDPNNAEAYQNRGKVYLEKKEYEKAAADFQNAIQKDPERLEALYDKASAFIEMDEWDKAMSDLNRYISAPSNEKSFKALERRGYVYLRKGEYDKAIEECNKAINLNPGYFPAMTTKGKAQKAKANQ